MNFRSILGRFILAYLALTTVVSAQQTDSVLALTFEYSPIGDSKELAAGYRNHLSWHEANRDTILWYAWFVVNGPRSGHFIDGAFDVTGAEFDARPDPAGDFEDASRYFLKHAKTEGRRVFRMRSDLATSTFLEDRNPSALMNVVSYYVTPGTQPNFEATAKTIRQAAEEASIKYSVYELISGDQSALYAVVFPMTGFADFDNPFHSLEQVAKNTMPDEAAMAVLATFATVIQRAHSETWSFRADLSLMNSER